MRFENPANGYVETLSAPFLWALIFGPLYFLIKGVWRHVILYFIVNGVLLSVAGGLAVASAIAAATATQAFDATHGLADPARTGITAAAAVAALVLPFLIYPFFAAGIVRRHYLRMGWIEIDL